MLAIIYILQQSKLTVVYLCANAEQQELYKTLKVVEHMYHYDVTTTYAEGTQIMTSSQKYISLQSVAILFKPDLQRHPLGSFTDNSLTFSGVSLLRET
jgi:predicted ATP-dependent Lon-type protease